MDGVVFHNSLDFCVFFNGFALQTSAKIKDTYVHKHTHSRKTPTSKLKLFKKEITTKWLCHTKAEHFLLFSMNGSSFDCMFETTRVLVATACNRFTDWIRVLNCLRLKSWTPVYMVFWLFLLLEFRGFYLKFPWQLSRVLLDFVWKLLTYMTIKGGSVWKALDIYHLLWMVLFETPLKFISVVDFFLQSPWRLSVLWTVLFEKTLSFITVAIILFEKPFTFVDLFAKSLTLITFMDRSVWKTLDLCHKL